MSKITSHVLDTALGRPVVGLKLTLWRFSDERWNELGHAVTDDDGRVAGFRVDGALTIGIYRLGFETGAHFAAQGRPSFYERVQIEFRLSDASEHYHVPLLLSPFGYSTYRGS